MVFNACKVAVSAANYAIDKLYNYKISKNLEGDIIPGIRVLVPFGRGNKLCEGVVVKIEFIDDTDNLKPVSTVLDVEPVLDEKMLKLAAFMRERLFCTFFDCIKAMLPVGLWFKYNEEYICVATESDLLKLSEKEKKVCELFLGSDKAIKAKDIFISVGGKNIGHLLRKLCEKGILKYKNKISQKAKDKTVTMYFLSVPFEEAIIKAEKGRSAVRVEIVSALNTEGAMSAKELSYMTGATKSIINTMVKNGVLSTFKEEVFRVPDYNDVEKGVPIVLSNEQQEAYDAIRALLNQDKPNAALLYGVTGSGKTQVYIKLINDVLKKGKKAIILVPEIGLTPQLISKFIAYFGDDVTVMHSALSVGERFDSWKKAKRGAGVIIGTRSAVFAPVTDLGIIIIDEEQDSAYKSENSPRYHARDIAKYRITQNNALLVLGSATPSIETYYDTQNGKYPVFTLKERYVGNGLPMVKIADMRGIIRQGFSGMIGPVLREEIKKNLEDKKQTILFINRRGHSKQVSCAICGWTPTCDRCSVNMTYHSISGRLMCHYCANSYKLPPFCPECGSEHIQTEVAGTQKVEKELVELFPNAKVLRMDADTVSNKNAHQKMFNTFLKGKADILLGTQMVTKGLDFENVTLVGVLDADQALYTQDYRAKEKTFSQITQVVGRAGRRFAPGRAIIQTYSPNNPTILLAARQDYEGFYENEILIRMALQCPPVAQILVLTASGETEHSVLRSLTNLKTRIESLMEGQFNDYKYDVLGPAPATIVRINNRYRYHISIRCPENKRRRELIGGILREFSRDKNNRGITLFADINPQDI